MNELDYIKRQLDLKKDNIDCLVSKKYEIDSKIGKIHDEIELLELEATNQILENKGLDYEFSIDLTKIIDDSVIFSAKSSEEILFKITDSPILKNFENPDNVYLSIFPAGGSGLYMGYEYIIAEINESRHINLNKTHYREHLGNSPYLQHFSVHYSSLSERFGTANDDPNKLTDVVFKIDESTISIDE